MSSPEAAGRGRAMLRTAMGLDIAAALADPLVLEVMVNPDGALRLDRLGEGRVETGRVLDPAHVERIVRLVASNARSEAHAGSPTVSAELPLHGEVLAGERFKGVLPPVSRGPCFSITKPAERVYRLLDYARDGIMSAEAARFLSLAAAERRTSSSPAGPARGTGPSRTPCWRRSRARRGSATSSVFAVRRRSEADGPLTARGPALNEPI